MDKIPTHRMSELLHGEIAFMRYISGNEQPHPVNYAHRDDFYIFLFSEKGTAKLLIDFEEYELTGSTVRCILPGQVHFPVGYINGCGWILALDSMLIKDEYKEIFERVSFLKNKVELNKDIINDLRYCISAIYKRLKPERQHIEEGIMRDLLSYYIGIIAEIYQKGLPVSTNNRPATITFQFKSLLSANYQSLKRPSQYASKLNISPVYLNEAVKRTTGLTVSDCIQNEIIIQAKRLLFYTNISIKEIALKLGYEDWAYFTRLFTKASKLSPTQFRRKYLK
ncbi:MAG: AraC family transcriptional regulator [Flavobacteriaceae bacterium]|jgi:AraC-like DNA-binding protein|nr:AraC family transcriptional regulator [Flavobacteriaceae bacterium]